MKKFAIAAMMIASFPVSAYSQQAKGPLTARTEQEMKRDNEIDKAYRETMKKPEDSGQAAKIDPWKIIRPVDTESTKH